MQKQIRIALSIFCGVILFFIMNIIVLKQADIPSDYITHIQWANAINFNSIPQNIAVYPMWHILTKVFSVIMPIDYAAAFVTGCAVLLSYFFTEKIINKQLHHWVSAVIAFFMCVTMPIYLPWFNYTLYLGQPTPNVWHSPTNILVKPFAIFIFYYFFEAYKENDMKKNIFFIMLLCFSMFAKPSLIQCFLPAAGIFLIIEALKKKISWREFIVKCLYCIPILILLLWQIDGAFDNSQIGISYLTVWSHYSPNIMISLFLGLAFPLYVICCNKMKGGGTLHLAILMLVVGLTEYIFLIETGRPWDGNFNWGLQIATYIFWLEAMQIFVSNLVKNKEKVYYYIISWSLLCLHFFSGVYYLYCLVFIPLFVF